ncbi:MAG: serine/threonine protein kinase [Micromonosporaceae bacterium]|nr:serine/threonine protein kinase [Micromonosporaceae bacterium]
MDEACDGGIEPATPLQGDPSPLEPGDPCRIGAYDIVARLGAGGMGTVFLGRSASRDEVAVKLVHRHLVLDHEFRARFASEANAGLRLPAFCSAKVLATGEHAGQPYLVTEYIDGISLSRLIAQEGYFDLSALHSLAVGTISGIVAIHSADLVHRDIKPSNIIVTLGGVRIIDFGIARALDQTSGYTRTGIVMGSLGWAAPEQLEGTKPHPSMDIFAWGCVMAYAATGRHPFGPGGLDTRANRAFTAKPDLAGVPEPLRALVASALSKSPAGRPTAQHLLLALVGAAPIRGHRWSVASLAHPRRVVTALAVALPLAAVVAIGASMGLGSTGNDPPAPGSPRAPRVAITQTDDSTSGGQDTGGGPGRGDGPLPPARGDTPPVPGASSQVDGAVPTTSPGVGSSADPTQRAAASETTATATTPATTTTSHTPNPASSKNKSKNR